MLRAAGIVAAVTLAVAPLAGAVTPAVSLAKALKADMQSYYKKQGLVFTTVTCKISADQSSALCHAHFTVKAKRAIGVFVVQVTETAAGQAQTKTLSTSCTDSKTHKKISCF